MVKSKILFIGLDSADKDLVTRWARAGELPVFARLLETAAYAATHNPPGLYVGAIWPSFYTGRRAVSHGRFAYRQLIPGTYKTREMETADIRGEPFWRHLSDAGMRVGVIDVPKSRLTRDINGFHLVDWGTHDADWKVGFHGWPERLAADIRKRYGTDPVGPCDRPGRGVAGFRELTNGLLRRIERKGALSRELLLAGEWDLCATVFSEAHCVGHQCWHLHDPGHPAHRPGLAGDLADPILTVYKALDREVGALIDAAGPAAAVFVLASHGMRPNYAATYFLDDILRALARTAKTRGRVYRALNQVWEAVPMSVRAVLKPVQNRVRENLMGGDRAVRRCFQVPNNGVYGGIRVNLKGREPAGLVAPGAETEALYDELSQQLSGLVNPRSGRPLVKRLWRLEEWYEPGASGEFPDFFVEWHRESYVDSAEIPGRGVIQVESLSTRTGDHENAGLVFMQKAGLQADAVRRPIDIEDFAPTFCGLLGVDASRYDGRPIWALAD